MRTKALPFFAIVLAVVLTACGEMRWHKPDVDDASLGNDLAACQAAAHSAIQRMYGPLQPSMGSAHIGGAPVEPSLADRQMREQQAVGQCMREKGYTLVPVER